ncbi:hypothetical protein BC829DRAFT_262345 [Chytridium lagenaria]|nr:hypothetical protein BC829DRAFT_262345 [Chytridium lagenaria]
MAICLSISVLFGVSLLSMGYIGFSEVYGCWFIGDLAPQYYFYYTPLYVSVLATAVSAVFLSLHMRKLKERDRLLAQTKLSILKNSAPEMSLMDMNYDAENDELIQRDDSSYRILSHLYIYLLYPFVCEIFDLIVATSNISNGYLDFLSISFISLGGVFLMIAVIYDPSIQEHLQTQSS